VNQLAGRENMDNQAELGVTCESIKKKKKKAGRF